MLTMTERFAIYFAPPAASPLWLKAAEWLGRDALSGERFAGDAAGLPRKRLEQITGSARRYGFHATMKAPMALARGTTSTELEEALAEFVARRQSVGLGRLELRLLDGFLALVPVRQSEGLTAFAAECVTRFERFRRPLSASERQRREQGRLSPRQLDLLDRYGYPYVMEQFLFHMTLTDRLEAADRDPVMHAAADWFSPLLGQELLLDRLALFCEAEPGAPFMRMADFLLSTEVKVDA